MTLSIMYEGTSKRIKSIILNHRYLIKWEQETHSKLPYGKEQECLRVSCTDAYGNDQKGSPIISDQELFSIITSPECEVTDVQTDNTAWVELIAVKFYDRGRTMLLSSDSLLRYSQYCIYLPSSAVTVTALEYKELKEYFRKESMKEKFINAIEYHDFSPDVKEYFSRRSDIFELSEKFCDMCADSYSGDDEYDYISQIIESVGGLQTYLVECGDKTHEISMFPEQYEDLIELITEVQSGTDIGAIVKDDQGETISLFDVEDVIVKESRERNGE